MTDTSLLVAILAAAVVGAAVLVVAAIALARLSAIARQRETLERDLAALAKDLAVVRAQGEDLERDMKQDMQGARAELRQDLAIARTEQAQAAQTLRGEVGDRLTQFTGATQQQFEGMTRGQGESLKAFGDRLQDVAKSTQDTLRTASEQQGAHARTTADRLAELAQRSDQKLEAIRVNVEQRLDTLRSENAAKLEQMRATVDEKLQKTLEERLGASFKQVSDRLEQVHKGLGEMQTLAVGVGDLKRVLTNVKSRGTWGEVQLETLLADLLAPSQYEKNVATRPGSRERVEFAVRFPGSSADAVVWLPIDAKFPREDYERLLDAQEAANADDARTAGDALERRVRDEAKRIRGKYVSAPHTTEFAVLFLPTEGLYAEVLRRPGLFEGLQREQRITIAGPTTLLALLTSLQVGFRTVAIEKRSAEVWNILANAKREFGKFGDVMDSVKTKLEQASKQIDQTGVRTRAIERSLREVESLPSGGEPTKLLGGDEAE